MRNLYYLAIEGPIGVGKTSLANLMSEKLGARLVLEQFEENPFLKDFYKDPDRFAFQVQLFFLLQRYQQQQNIRQVDMFHNLLISDYMFIKDRLFASLNLGERDFGLYENVATHLERNIINPDLVIYLQADTDTLMKNVAKRGRDFEKNLSADYLDAVNQVYSEYFFNYQETPLVIINTNDIDFVENEEDLKEVIQYIREPVTGTKFFNPAATI
ncbi:MAG: deoxynucleoside kinase [Candidatus Marinimicrobia bacterium]|jgi:deoxyadenosine/deoxycytidine kinase|nr:deoxynucleoside kinase [Candidatus Neomarinimicrobiota bacterium]MBT3618373.1 deoxynucleoside kinase [Candidatus Neomarinimicrobiota bacterium]MBT3829168.1 deoxynucleoside kinase [Candidatus Neomarinimicrobiota bacterium]MBT3998136.1 deoxynucleoside kinase [Candidatus Neomarinimicrobiota bacterium]MBT4281477.1 deoxynucleoside kinase [Candidatus Neomarinimicrobiota bacterium]